MAQVLAALEFLQTENMQLTKNGMQQQVLLISLSKIIFRGRHWIWMHITHLLRLKDLENFTVLQV